MRLGEYTAQNVLPCSESLPHPGLTLSFQKDFHVRHQPVSIYPHRTVTFPQEKQQRVGLAIKLVRGTEKEIISESL